MTLRKTLLIFAIISLATVGVGGFFLISNLSETALKVARGHTEETAVMIQRQIDFYLLNHKKTSTALAQFPQFNNLLEEGENISVPQVNTLLKQYCDSQSASICYLMDTRGTAIASSNFNSPKSLVGKNYAFRPYFKEAITGQPATYLALGVTTKKRGFYFSSPVKSTSGRVTGVVVVKYLAEEIERELSGVAGIFTLIDNKGMVFASNKQDWLYRSLSELSTEDAKTIMKSRQFGEEKPSSVGLIETADGQLIAPDGENYLLGKHELQSPQGWHIYYLYSTTNINPIDPAIKGGKKTVRATFVLLFISITLIVVFLYRRASSEIVKRRHVERNLRDSEEKYRLLFEKSEDPMWVIDGNALKMANQAAAYTLGYRSVEELIALDPSSLSPPLQPDGEASSGKMKRLREIAFENGFHTYQWTHIRIDGEEFPAEVSLTRIPFDGHDALYCAWRDITESKMTHDALERAKTDAEMANKAKSEFLASMSHEIRTPITGVMGFTDMLLDDDLPDDSRDKVLQVRRSMNALLALLNEILDLSKLEAGKMEIENIDFHLPSLIEETTGLFLGKMNNKKLDLTTTLSDDCPQGVHADPTRIRQILLNLIGNATKFTEWGGIKIEVTLDQSGVGPDKLRFAVTDSGIGMTPASLARVFSEFTQADATINRKYQGSGLGLTICKRLVDLMDGEIGVESEIGKGSTFWFSLPFVPSTTPVFRPSKVDRTEDFETRRKLRILVVDDVSINRRTIKGAMEKYHHHVETANDGAEAVQAHERGDFDLILMDVRMPELSGHEATRIIRQIEGDKGKIPIIALTADAMKENRRECLEAGMDDMSTKPIDRPSLLRAINRVMGEEIHIPLKHGNDDQSTSEDGGGEKEAEAALLPVLDLGYLNEVFEDPDIIPELLQDFLQSTEPLIQTTLASMAADDREDAREAAHAIKGSARMAGAMHLGEVCARIQKALDENDTLAASQHVDLLRPAFEKVREAISVLDKTA